MWADLIDACNLCSALTRLAAPLYSKDFCLRPACHRHAFVAAPGPTRSRRGATDNSLRTPMSNATPRMHTIPLGYLSLLYGQVALGRARPTEWHAPLTR